MPHKSAPRSYGDALAEREGRTLAHRKNFGDLAVGDRVYDGQANVVGRVVGYSESCIYLKMNNGLSETLPGRALCRQSTWLNGAPIFANIRAG